MVGEYTVFLIILKNSKVWFSWHQKAFLDNVDETESQEVERDVHEVRRAIGHQPDDLVAHNLRVHGLSNVLFNQSLVVRLLHVQVLSFSHQMLRQPGSHQVFEL